MTITIMLKIQMTMQIPKHDYPILIRDYSEKWTSWKTITM